MLASCLPEPSRANSWFLCSIPRYGDMRVMMAYELFSMWQNLGRSFLHTLPLHILLSQIGSYKTNYFPQVL